MSMPPPVPTAPAPSQPIPNHLAWAIISAVVSFCLCCFVGGIPGIVAIVFAAQVNSKLNQGDIDGARRASDNAKTWCWVATGLAIFGLLLNIWGVMSGGTEEYMRMIEQMQQAQ
ncbi:CD225/dispanin family protein [Marilutibacter alkalisoli]|uniref:CD225/dispanin family protein n=1 Tax=Marilutibacter alkalisoli TaxID=2591633 RepID=A0A514BNU4_9GAMM|nr:CD225/dispanin family protein [Lysobacter alkalisoli]QDH69056.1 CD225/dispanin family protein [Lysobacter alkalisoli]